MTGTAKLLQLFAVVLTVSISTAEWSGTSGSVGEDKEVNVIFSPQFNGTVKFEFYRSAHDEGSEIPVQQLLQKKISHRSDDDIEGSGEKVVNVNFHPNFNRPVTFNHFRAESDKVCKPAKVCYSNDDCNGGSCVGDSVGTCNCAACSSFVTCQDDSVCGGLRGACNKQTGQCDCERGLHSLDFIQLLSRFLIAQFNVTNFPSFNPNGVD
ncbi:unnamed protein product [Anisakis simplex]|uniref:Disintegrin domain-containing protein n=1 Tax=Anisakis simplex TaxID=6269 RepID=A0A0M3KGZ8_ANISI|nr:unnamed protein product [Anisakis simplex]